MAEESPELQVALRNLDREFEVRTHHCAAMILALTWHVLLYRMARSPRRGKQYTCDHDPQQSDGINNFASQN